MSFDSNHAQHTESQGSEVDASTLCPFTPGCSIKFRGAARSVFKPRLEHRMFECISCGTPIMATPAGHDWCKSMGRPRSECGCKDCIVH